MYLRFVTPRARRTAWKVASVPLIVVTDISTDGKSSATSRAHSTSSSLVPNPVRSMTPKVSVTAWLTRASECPSRIAPNAAW